MKKIIFYVVLIAFASCKSQQVSIANTEWKLVKLNDQDVSDLNPPITLSLDETQKKVNGFAGCNRFFGSYELNESTLQFGAMGSTKMFCQDQSATEDKYLKALGVVQSFKSEGDRLLLKTGENVVLEFKK